MPGEMNTKKHTTVDIESIQLHTLENIDITYNYLDNSTYLF